MKKMMGRNWQKETKKIGIIIKTTPIFPQRHEKLLCKYSGN